MSVVRSSLQRLTAAIGKLENSVDQLETSMAGEQRDMFGAPASNENGSEGTLSGSENKKVIAERLDVAIDKVEKLLGQKSA